MILAALIGVSLGTTIQSATAVPDFTFTGSLSDDDRRHEAVLTAGRVTTVLTTTSTSGTTILELELRDPQGRQVAAIRTSGRAEVTIPAVAGRYRWELGTNGSVSYQVAVSNPATAVATPPAVPPAGTIRQTGRLSAGRNVSPTTTLGAGTATVRLALSPTGSAAPLGRLRAYSPSGSLLLDVQNQRILEGGIPTVAGAYRWRIDASTGVNWILDVAGTPTGPPPVTSTTTTSTTSTSTTAPTTTTSTTVPTTTTTSTSTSTTSTSTTSTSTTTTTTTVPPGGSRPAPNHVLATPGPLGSGRVAVTWDRSDPTATGYEVRRDGAGIGGTTLSGDAWDDMALNDTGVPAGAHSYQVRALFPGGQASAWSSAYDLTVRSPAGVGAVFQVDSFAGTDLQRAQAAVDAAAAAGGGIVQFAARTYSLSDTLRVNGVNDVVLRGDGLDRTFVQPTFDGGTTDPCGAVRPMIQFQGTFRSLGPRSSGAIAVDQRSVNVGSTAGLSVGQVIVFDQKQTQVAPSTFQANGIAQDPGSGNDRRYNWDANEIVSLSGSSVTFRFPFSQPFTSAVDWRMLEGGLGNGLESLTVQGRGSGETAYQRLVDLDYQGHFGMAEVQGRWANRNFVRIRGFDVDVVGFQGAEGGTRSYSDEPCKYKFTITQASNVTFVGAVMGSPAHDRNRSPIVSQWAQRIVVRDSLFYGSRTHGLNEHGGGSRHHVYENNYFATGSTSSGAVSLGNGSWGFTGPVIVRNNTFENNTRDLEMYDHPYEVRFLDNVSRGCIVQCVLWSGWGPMSGYSPIANPALYGSARLTIARNRFEGARSIGIHLGNTYSQSYPYLGVKDVAITGNFIGSSSTAIRLYGDANATQRFQVSGNTGANRYTRPSFTAGSYWQGNADGTSFGSPSSQPWMSEVFPWVAQDRVG